MTHDVTSQEAQLPQASAPADPPAPPPDDRNPAIIDARKTFVVTLVGAALFIGSVFVFIL